MDDRIECSCGVRYFPKLAWKHAECAPRVTTDTSDSNVNVVFPGFQEKLAVLVANPKPVANRKGDRHKDREARKVYQRDLMRRRRAEGRA